MIEGYRKLTEEEVVRFAAAEPFQDEEDGRPWCRHQAAPGVVCTRLSGHPGTLHISHHSPNTPVERALNQRYVPQEQWFSVPQPARMEDDG